MNRQDPRRDRASGGDRRQQVPRRASSGNGNSSNRKKPNRVQETSSRSRTHTHELETGHIRNRKPKSKGIRVLVGRTFLSIFLVGIITVCLVAGAFLIYVFGFVDGTMEEDLNDLKIEATTFIYVNDAEGNPQELQRLHGVENRIWVSIDEMPLDLQHAFIALEDKRFYDHEGVDWQRTFSAFANMIFNFYGDNQGGSTITQQLVKNLTEDDEVTPMRKIREIMRARYLEQTYSKDTIIECYLNLVNLGNGCYGVQAASEYYFGKDNLDDLTPLECASLASIVKSPTYYEPIGNSANNKERRDWCVGQMYEQGYITDQEYAQAQKEEIAFTGKALEREVENTQINSYFVDALINNVIAQLQEEYGYSYNYAENMVYAGGLRIYATLDTELQAKVDEIYANPDNFTVLWNDEDIQPESAAVIMDYSGHVVAIAGSRKEKTVNRALNLATDYNFLRSPGSTIKPLAVYAPAIEYDLITYSTIVKNEPIRGSWPENYGGVRGSGTAFVHGAVAESLNTVPVRILQDLSYEKSYDFLENNFGITTLVKSMETAEGIASDMGDSPLALGGLTEGVTPMEMTAAYATFGNLGKYYEPVLYTKITDAKGKTVLEASESGRQAMSEETATIMNELLQKVVYGSNGTGSRARIGEWPLFGKSGTSNANLDRYYIGGSPYYVCSVWYGYEIPQELTGLYSNPCPPIWQLLMSAALEGKELKGFPVSENAHPYYYCTVTGLVANSGCPKDIGWYKDSTLQYCTSHGGSHTGALDYPGELSQGYGGYVLSSGYGSGSTNDETEESSEEAPSSSSAPAETSATTSTPPATTSTPPATTSTPPPETSTPDTPTSSQAGGTPTDP